MKQSLFIFASLLATTNIYAFEKSICGQMDSRQPSNESAVGRLLSHPAGRDACTATLISERCAITAGHCNAYTWMEFNVPPSSGGKLNYALPSDLYQRDRVFGREEIMPGYDWLVFSLRPNQLTGLHAGAVQGFYQIAEDYPLGGLLRITGYGMHSDESLTYTQQSAEGELKLINQTQLMIEHRVDTYGGNSGSAIVDLESGKIIGVHTHGDCVDSDNFPNSSNMGTLIWGNEKFKKAIQACIEAQ